MTSSFFSGAGYLQFPVVPGDPATNLTTMHRLLDRLAPSPGTIVALPELWATGFDYASAERLAQQTPALLQELTTSAEERGIILAGSLLEKVEKKGICNTLFFVGPGGVLGRYRKQHLFPLWREDEHFAPGDPPQPVDTHLGVLGGLICYDLRFPGTARDQVFQGARLVVVSAQWPAVRIDHWQTLVRARAIENQVFVLACNGCGPSGEHLLGGRSMVVGPDGTVLLEAGAGEAAETVALDGSLLDSIRQGFRPAGERARQPRDREKMVSLPSLLERLARIRPQGGRIAFTNGCFDILHSGHVAYLEEARSTADCLVVGLNSDRSVRELKGPGRPVNPEADRARVLAALECVDFVVLFDQATPYELITTIMPDVLVKGADWREEDIVGAEEVKNAGGRVVRVPFEHQVSTTGLLERIRAD
ncbi:MAG: hypothetical protein Kow0089_12070 [Desulfobulbaceae bacterium]